jgi:hypothetical protein
MKRKITLLFFTLVCVSSFAETKTEVEHPPQEMTGRVAEQEQFGKTLVHNARIYTMDRGYSTADAILFDSSGRIHNVGGEEDMLKAFPSARHIDLNGKQSFPA